MDGMTSTRAIRFFENSNNLPRCCIVALTGLASASARLEALSSGVDHFMTKPMNFRELEGLLKRSEAKSRRRVARRESMDHGNRRSVVMETKRESVAEEKVEEGGEGERITASEGQALDAAVEQVLGFTAEEGREERVTGVEQGFEKPTTARKETEKATVNEPKSRMTTVEHQGETVAASQASAQVHEDGEKHDPGQQQAAAEMSAIQDEGRKEGGSS
jgi:CheY-like chemotaxis protein